MRRSTARMATVVLLLEYLPAADADAEPSVVVVAAADDDVDEPAVGVVPSSADSCCLGTRVADRRKIIQ